MKTHACKRACLLILAAAVCSLPARAGDTPNFTGAWCVSGEGLVITFLGEDSLRINSLRDESVSGAGKYEQSDTTLVASIENEELHLEMGYRYAWQADTLVRARIMFFKVNGDSVNHPRQWLRMSRCQPELHKADSDSEEKDASVENAPHQAGAGEQTRPADKEEKSDLKSK